MEVNGLENMENAEVVTDIESTAIKKIFRMVFAGENCLVELFPNPVIANIDDVKLLDKNIEEKLSRHNTSRIAFKAIASFDNGRSLEYGSWEGFIGSDWSTPDTINSLSLTWMFMLVHPSRAKPSMHSLNVRISSSISPQHLFQALFSKDPEDFDKADIAMSTMSVRIDFVDFILGQEMLDLVSRWNKGLRTPSFVLPSLLWAKRHVELISAIIRRSIPLFTIASSFSYFLRLTREMTGNGYVSIDIFKNTIMWGIVSIIVVLASWAIGRFLSTIVHKQLYKLGRFSAIEFTRGDANRQTKLIAKNTNSVWKSIAGAAVALILNIIGGIITVFLLGN